jgi:hypothetical protein
MLALGVVSPPLALAQTPPRFYLDTLSGSSAVPLIFQSTSGNTNPFDAAHTVTQDANFDATLATVGYARTFSLFDRAAMAAILLPMGRISGDVSVAGNTFSQSASGFGDPMLEFSINVIGPPAQKNIPDVMRYEPGFSMHLLADLAQGGADAQDRAVDVDRLLAQEAPGLGQREAARAAVDQPLAQPVLQPLERRGDRGLLQAQPFGRAGDGPGLGQHEEGAQEVPVQIAGELLGIGGRLGVH